MNVILISKIYNPGPYIDRSDQFMIYIKDQNGFDISQSIVSATRNDIRYVFNVN